MHGHSLRPPARLFAVYAALSAVPVVVLGIVLDQTYRGEARLQGIARGQEQAAVIEEMAVSPALSGDDLSLGLSDGERERLSAATDLAVYHGSVLRLRLRDFDGRVVFSDDGRSDFVVPVSSPAFRAASVGRTHAEVVTAGSLGRSVRVLRPVVTHASGRSTGVLELYLPYDGSPPPWTARSRAPGRGWRSDWACSTPSWRPSPGPPRAACGGTPRSGSTRPCTTRSPACRTGRCSRSAPSWSAPVPPPTPRPRWCSSTWTGSST